MAKVEGRENFGEDPKFFIGKEVEQTPLKGRRTLFVIGAQNPKEILARCLNNKIDHVYLGCADSFKPTKREDWTDWDFIITTLLEADVWVTLDFDSGFANHNYFQDYKWNENAKFIPMIAVRLPYIDKFNYNATLKLDDKSFEGTNTGVWCHQLHDLKDRSNYTDWTEYVGDEVIE